MSDLFATGIQVPNLPEGQARPADDPLFIRIFVRNDRLYGRKSDGTEVDLGSSTVVVGDNPVFIQETQPTHSGKYLWIQTNIDADPNNFSLWFEDGIGA